MNQHAQILPRMESAYGFQYLFHGLWWLQMAYIKFALMLHRTLQSR